MKLFSYGAQLLVLTMVVLSVPLTVNATQTTQELSSKYEASGAGGAGPFSSKAGEALWTLEQDGRSCTSCHSLSVKKKGQHKRTGKVIEPMAPSINPQRLNDRKNIAKWFLRNCKWTYGRECTIQEKGDILHWLSQQ